MKIKIIVAAVGLVVVAGLLGGIKFLQISRMMAQQRVMPPEIVTIAAVQQDSWESVLTSVGSLVAVQGVTVAAEMTGKVVQIAFEPGMAVQAGDLLVQQDIAAETAQLRAAEASADLMKINLERARRLLREKTASQSDFDNADAQYKQAVAQVDNLRALIAKKTIRAPFSGLLGIRLVNLGQILNAGDAIVSLQSLDPIFVNFSLPQQQLARLKLNLAVRVQSDTLPGQEIEGTITAINPQVDSGTRNIMVQATLANVRNQLRPGMFVNVAVVLPEQQTVLAIPATAVLNAPYSDSVFVVENDNSSQGHPPAQVLRQQFVRLGPRRGDFVAVRAGLQQGETVVSTGVFKLRNKQSVTIDNSLSPEFKIAPAPKDT